MGVSPVYVLFLGTVLRVIIAVMNGTGLGAALGDEAVGIEPCDDLLDVITGCGGGLGAFIGFVVGVINGAPLLVNGLLALSLNGSLVWAVIKLARGVTVD